MFAVLFIGGAGGVAYYMHTNKPEPQRGAPVAKAPLVDTVVLEAQDVRETLFGFGTARSDQQATLAAEVSAAIVEIVDDLHEGSAVDVGQSLVRLDDRQYQQDLFEAMAMVESARAELAQIKVERGNLGNLLEIATSDLDLNREELERVKGLYEQANAPKTEYDDARLAYQNALRAKQQLDNQLAMLEPQRLRLQAQLTGAEARSERAKLNIERCDIIAPFDGVVQELMVEIGDRVRIGSPILAIVNLDRIEVPLELPVSDRARTSIGAEAELTIESLPENSWKGSIARIAPVANERSRTFAVYVEIDNKTQDEPLMPGVFVRAEMAGPEIHGALIVPRSAVIENNVYVANDHMAHKRRVSVHSYLGNRAVVAGEVRAGDKVIITNLDLLFDGAAVRTEGEVMASSNGDHTVKVEERPVAKPDSADAEGAS